MDAVKLSDGITKFFKSFFLTIISIACILVFSTLYVSFLRDTLDRGDSMFMLNSSLSIGLMIAGSIAAYARLQIRKISAFIQLSVPCLILSFLALYLFPDYRIAPLLGQLASIYPLFGWIYLRLAKRDHLFILFQKIQNLGKIFLRKKTTRILIAAYAAWIFILITTNNFEFTPVTEFFYYYELETLLWFALSPLPLIAVTVVLYKWCKRGE
jgi:hypothetical protein